VSKWNVHDRRKKKESKDELALTVFCIGIVILAIMFWPVTLSLIAIAILWNILKNRKG